MYTRPLHIRWSVLRCPPIGENGHKLPATLTLGDRLFKVFIEEGNDATAGVERGTLVELRA